jgi:hypothetical protein
MEIPEMTVTVVLILQVAGNGEFHTFCFDGLIFKKPIDFVIGEKFIVNTRRPKIKRIIVLQFI